MLLIPSVLTAQTEPLTCGPQCDHVDHDFEDWLAFRASGSRESNYFTKYIPVAFHSFNGAITPEIAENAFALLQEQMLGSNIVPCRHQGNFYNEWEDLETEHPVYDNPLYFQAMQAVEMANTPATDVCNIFVFESVGDGIGGFSWINQNPATRPWDGIYLKATSSATSTITHEMGHYCGLYHTFNAGSCNNPESDCELQGDRVCDTPPTSVNFSCENPFCESADYTNHMDYTPNECRDHFTLGQITRMHTLLVNGNRSSVWQSGLCSDPELLDVSVLSITNSRRCDEDFTPIVKLGNYTMIDAENILLNVTMNGQNWDTLVNVPSFSIASFEGPALDGNYMQEYTVDAYILLTGDTDPDNNVNSTPHNPMPYAVLNVDVQHDAWPESEQWKVYREGQVGSLFTGLPSYAQGGSWGSVTSYDTWEDGFNYVPLFTHDEVCLVGGCYSGFFRHFGYASTQELYNPSNPDYQGMECGISVYIDRGLETDTIYEYFITAFDEDGNLNIMTEEDNHEYLWAGFVHGTSQDQEYNYCVEDLYWELVDDIEDDPEFECLGDFDGDGAINLDDLLAICTEMGKEGECQCDMDGDADVDVQDFAAFLGLYGTDCEGEELPPPPVRVLEELGLNPVYYTMEGKRVPPGPVAFGVYIAEFEINGVKNRIKVIQ